MHNLNPTCSPSHNALQKNNLQNSIYTILFFLFAKAIIAVLFISLATSFFVQRYRLRESTSFHITHQYIPGRIPARNRNPLSPSLLLLCKSSLPLFHSRAASPRIIIFPHCTLYLPLSSSGTFVHAWPLLLSPHARTLFLSRLASG